MEDRKRDKYGRSGTGACRFVSLSHETFGRVGTGDAPGASLRLHCACSWQAGRWCLATLSLQTCYRRPLAALMDRVPRLQRRWPAPRLVVLARPAFPRAAVGGVRRRRQCPCTPPSGPCRAAGGGGLVRLALWGA
eukprot:jgi/Ulvmu1/3575/UM168_0007.1